jgi:tRNA(Arg) A34 adenosine deaminase TadA
MSVRLPAWVWGGISESGTIFPTLEDRMRAMIDLARENVKHGGGPFAAGIFDAAAGRLIAPGVNLVLTHNCSVLHAEIVAIMLAQQTLLTWRLRDKLPDCELVATTEPCAMCLGAIGWAGITRLVCGARDQDARAIGFDEGDKPLDWINGLKKRGIDVVTGVLGDQARQVLEEYQQRGGEIYNG